MPRSTLQTEVLEIAYESLGPVDGPVVILMHGFPYDVRAYDAVATRLADEGVRVVVPYLRGFGPTRFLSDATLRSGQQAALGADLLALMDGLGIDEAVLGGYDWGGRAACIVAALQPDRVRGLVTLGGYNIQDIPHSGQPAHPATEQRFWYQYYFHGERGREGLRRNRTELCRVLWEDWSPSWHPTQQTFDATSASFDNPDFVDVVIHSYRHRYGLVPGDPAYEDMERRLAEQPSIEVPTVVLVGGDDGVDPPTLDLDASTGLDHFVGYLELRVIPGAGHNLPQEKPDEFADAIAALM